WTPPTKKTCMIVSNKVFTPFHARRREVLAALLESDAEIDFYGRGLSGPDPRIKGEIPPFGKGEVIIQYSQCIDFENSPHSAVTDKFFDAVLAGATPVTNATILRRLLPDG